MSIGWQCPKLQLWVWQEEVSNIKLKPVSSSKKKSIRDGCSTALNAVYTVDTVDTVDTGETVDTVFTVVFSLLTLLTLLTWFALLRLW